MKKEMGALVSEALADAMPVLSLRGVDGWAREGGDLDFMVPPGKAVAACRLVARLAQSRDWYIALFRDIGYLCQIVLVRPAEDGKDDAIKVDIFDGLRWYGVGRDVAGEKLFGHILLQDGHKEKVAGVASFFQKVMIVGQATERDWSRVVATGADRAYLNRVGQELGLCITENQIQNRGVSGLAKWRLRASSGGAGSPLALVFWFFRASIAHIKFKAGVGTHAGLVLGISGLDGSGKSTLVGRLVAAYRKAGGEEPELVHLLPSWIPMPHQIFRRQQTNDNYTKPYSEPPVSSRLNGGLRLAYYILAFLLAKSALWTGAKRGRLTVLDRSFLDFASDPTRSRIPFKQLPRWLVRLLVPVGSLYYLDASPDVVVARKGELSFEKATSLQKAYHLTSARVDGKILNGDGTPDEVFKDLLGYISREYMGRIEITRGSK